MRLKPETEAVSSQESKTRWRFARELSSRESEKKQSSFLKRLDPIFSVFSRFSLVIILRSSPFLRRTMRSLVTPEERSQFKQRLILGRSVRPLARASFVARKLRYSRRMRTDTIPLSQFTGSFAIPPSPAIRPARKPIRATPIVPIPGRPRFPDLCDRKPPLEEEPLFSRARDEISRPAGNH